MENMVTDGKWAQAHSVPIYRGGDDLVNQGEGDVFKFRLKYLIYSATSFTEAA